VEPYADHRLVALPALAVLFTFTTGQSQHTNTLLASYARPPSLHLLLLMFPLPYRLSKTLFASHTLSSLYFTCMHFTSLHYTHSPVLLFHTPQTAHQRVRPL